MSTNFRRRGGRNWDGKNKQSEAEKDAPFDPESAMSESNEKRYRQAKQNDMIDRRYGFEPFTGPGDRFGWLVNMHPSDMLDESKNLVSAIDLFFLQSDGSRFKVTRPYSPYFFVAVGGNRGVEAEVHTFLSRKFVGRIVKIEFVEKNDLDMDNHLVGTKARYLKLSFNSIDELTRVRKEIANRVKANKEIQSLRSTYTDMLGEHFKDEVDGLRKQAATTKATDALDYLTDIREYDVPYIMRVSIDLNVFAAHWYTIRCRPSLPAELIRSEETVAWPEPVVLAFDIETTKLPLKFPDATIDQVIIIQYYTFKTKHSDYFWGIHYVLEYKSLQYTSSQINKVTSCLLMLSLCLLLSNKMYKADS